MPVLVHKYKSTSAPATDIEHRSMLPPLAPGTQTPVWVDIGLINNMSDAALQSTDRQFFALLQAAAGDIIVRIRFYSLPDVPRTECGRLHIANNYCPIDELRYTRLDALIVTGREPKATNLRDEPYWAALARVIDWAENNTISSIWSCLAAHAAVLHIDGIGRSQLDEKRFGIYECSSVSDHPLMAGVPAGLLLPHSRLNDVCESNLTSNRYGILARSANSGPDIFIKQRKSLFLFFQGHPEYETHTLMLEYRRDIGRFLKGERDTYPSMPEGYFDDEAVAALVEFREKVFMQPRQDMLVDFPAAAAAAKLKHTWLSGAVRLCGNWLSYIVARRS